ncbi:RNA-directed DNA polymerase, eukaryota [Tanacetum coccineum]
MSLKITSQPNIISYFFTNIPSGLNETILWKAFSKKTTVNGRRFRFARFLNVDDPASFEKILNTITFNNQHLKVNIAKYQRTNIYKSHDHKRIATPIPQNTTAPVHSDHSSANVVTDKANQFPPSKPITIYYCPDLTTTLELSLVGELFTIDTFKNLLDILQDIGIPNHRIKYLGGFFVLLELENINHINTLLSNSSIGSLKDTDDDSTSSHGNDSDTQDDDDDEDNDEDDLFDDNYRDDTDNELFLNGDADYLMYDGGWIREDDHVDCENNVDMDCGSNNNADGEVDYGFKENDMKLLERSENNLNFPGTHDGQTTPMSAQQLRKLC